ncbi:MAG: AMP-binding protein [Betaproteobacteria bacterium]|nr:MAG: AMP-binding protein [Betaproteobacteria bacterium]
MLDLGRSFLASAERSPRATAIVDGELRLNYADWLSRIGAVAGGLTDLGLHRGDHLLVAMQNRWQMATLHWACQFLGVIVTPLNWRAKFDEVEYCAVDAQARAVAYDESSADAVTDSAACKAIPRIVAGHIGNGELAFDSLLSASAPQQLLQADAEDWSVMLYTSGTTGKPKGVPRRHRAERAAAVAHVAQNLYSVGERTLGVMPLYHTMGVRSLLSMALVNGCFVCLPRFDAGEALQIIARERISNLYLVPTLYHDLLAHEAFRDTDIESVRRLGFAGAPMSEDLLRRLDGAFRPDLFVNHYGSSEIYTFTVDPAAQEKPGSAGKAGLNTRVRVVKLNAQTADELATAGEEGQIIADLTGDEAFEGYWRRPDADTKSLRQGWYFTGDTGYFDKDGDLFVTGRVDDMIISGGENISPVEIESVLSLHDAVDEVAVAGLSDERWGQKVVAFIKRKSPVDAQALDLFCRNSELLNFKRPREYVFVRDIPKSPVGKILRRKLVAREYEQDN